jgi:hypothetical protein
MKIHPFAIFLGLIVSVVVSVVAGTLLLLAGLALADTATHIFSVIFGSAGLVVAGFIVSRKSSSDKYLNTSILGAICMLQNLAAAFTTLSNTPLWFRLIAVPLNILFPLLGAYIEQHKMA